MTGERMTTLAGDAGRWTRDGRDGTRPFDVLMNALNALTAEIFARCVEGAWPVVDIRGS